MKFKLITVFTFLLFIAGKLTIKLNVTLSNCLFIMAAVGFGILIYNIKKYGNIYKL